MPARFVLRGAVVLRCVDDNLVEDSADRRARILRPPVAQIGAKLLQVTQIVRDDRWLNGDYLGPLGQLRHDGLKALALFTERREARGGLRVRQHALDRQIGGAVEFAVDAGQPHLRLFPLKPRTRRELPALFVVKLDEQVELAPVDQLFAQAVKHGGLDLLQVEAVTVVA